MASRQTDSVATIPLAILYASLFTSDSESPLVWPTAKLPLQTLMDSKIAKKLKETA